MSIYRTLLLLVGLLLQVFSNAFAYEQDLHTPLDKVSVQLAWEHQFEFAGFYAAIDKGFYREQGLEVELREYKTDTNVVEEVNSGRATFGVSNSQVISERLNGEGLVLMANYFKRPSLVLVGQKGIRTLEDMQGKRLMISSKDLQSPIIQLALKSAGLVPGKNLQIVPHDFETDSFIQKNVDVSAGSLSNEPFFYEQANHPFNIIDIAHHLPGLGDVYLFSSEEESQKNEQRTRDFIEATNEGWRYALDNPDEIVNLILKQYSTKKSRSALQYEAIKTREMILPVAFPIGSIHGQRVKNVAEALVGLNQAVDLKRLNGFLFDGSPSLGVDQTKDQILSPDEKAWVAERSVVTFGYNKDLPPVILEDKNGSHSGIMIDYLSLLEERTGLDFQLKLGSFKDIIESDYKHQIDVLGPVFELDRHRQYLNLTSPVFRSYPYIYVRSDTPTDISGLDDLSEKRVAYIAGQKVFEQIKVSHPEISFIAVENNEKLVTALMQEEVEAALAPVTFEYWRKENTHSSFKAVAPLLEFSGNVALGVDKEQPMLHRVIEKGLMNISKREQQEILNRWFGTEAVTEHKPDSPTINLNQDEQDWLAAHPEVVIGFPDTFPPMLTIDQSGHRSGILVDYINLLRRRLGINLRLEIHSPKENITRAIRRDVDVIGAAIKQDSLQEHFDFTSPLLTTYPYIYVRSDFTRNLSSPESLYGMRVGYFDGTSLVSRLFQRHPEITPIPFDNNLELAMSLISGEVDAIVAPPTLEYWRKKNSQTGFKVTGLLNDYGAEVSMAVRKDWPELASILNKGFDSISEAERLAITNRWLNPNQKNAFAEMLFQIEFTQEEEQWLQDHPVIKTSVDPHWAPVEFFNEEGGAEGISIDYLKHFEKILGIKIVVEKSSSWSDAKHKLEQGAIDLLPSMSKTLKRSDSLLFTTPYLSIPIAIFTGSNVAYLGDLTALTGKKVAVLEDSALHEWLQSNHPDLDILPAKNIEEGLHWISRGEAFAFVGNMVSTSYYIGQLGLPHIHVAGETPYEYELSMAVSNNDEIFRGILQKTLNTMPKNQRDAIYNNWISIRYEHRIDYKLLWMVLGLALFVFLTVAYWNRRLRKEINQRRLIESKLREARKIAELANQAKSQFLANMSHEIRTPMNAILGMSQLAMESHNNKKQQELISKVNHSAKSLLYILNDILVVSKIEADKLKLEEIDFELQPMLENVVDLLEHDANKKNLTLSLIVAADVPSVLRGDPMRLTQILTNLSNNALKFTHQGRITIFVGIKDKLGDLRTLYFCVNDTGVGISREDQSKLFQPFVQVDSSTSRKYGGTGLGLTICRQLSELMGGSIWVESELSGGSNFCFTAKLRIGSISQPSVKEREDGETEKLHGKRILLVEDNELNIELATELLTRTGLQVVQARNGEEALRTLQEVMFDIVLLDIQMPIMDGYSTARAIRQNPAFQGLPVIAISANVMNSDKEKALDAGMNDFVPKPIIFDNLIETLSYWIDHSGTHDGSRIQSSAETRKNNNLHIVAPAGIHPSKGFENSDHDYNLFIRMLRSFFRSIPQDKEILQTAKKNRSLEDIAKAAHNLKGAAMIIGATDIEKNSHELEDLIANNVSSDLIETSLDNLISELVKVEKSISHFYSTSSRR